jgi:hypothetical protein
MSLPSSSGFTSIGRPSISLSTPPAYSSSSYTTAVSVPASPAPAYNSSPSTATITIPLSSPSSSVPDSSLIRCEVVRYDWSPPSDFVNFPYRPHLGPGALQLLDYLSLLNEGMLTTYLIQLSVAAGSKDVRMTFLAGLSLCLLCSLAVGLKNFFLTSDTRIINRQEMELEMEHFHYHREVELEQLRNFLKGLSLSGNLLEAVTAQIGRQDESLLKIMQTMEKGTQEEGSGKGIGSHPIGVLLNSIRIFLMGSFVSLFPFFFVHTAGLGILISSLLVSPGLFAIGAYKTKAFHGNPWWHGFKNLFMGVLAAAAAYLVGYAFDSSRSQ